MARQSSFLKSPATDSASGGKAAPAATSARPSWGATIATGIIMAVVGVIAIAAPHLATMAVGIFIGVMLLVAGIVEVVRASRHSGAKGWWWSMLMGVLYAIAGIVLLINPLAGILALTIILAIFFIAKGIVAMTYSVRLRPLPNWGWLTMSGLASVAIGILVWIGWPDSALWAIGLLTGIEFLFFGLSLIMVGWAGKRQAG